MAPRRSISKAQKPSKRARRRGSASPGERDREARLQPVRRGCRTSRASCPSGSSRVWYQTRFVSPVIAHRLDRSLRRLQVGPSVAFVGFEVTALGPLVPGVDEDERVGVRRDGLGERGGEPTLVALGCRPDERVCAAFPPRRVVPPRHHATMPGMVGARLGQREVGHPVVLVERVDPLRMLRTEVLVHRPAPRLTEQLGRAHQRIGLELDRTVEPEVSGIASLVREVLDPAQVELADAEAGGLRSPGVGQALRLGMEGRAVDEEQSPAVHPHVPRDRRGPGRGRGCARGRRRFRNAARRAPGRRRRPTRGSSSRWPSRGRRGSRARPMRAPPRTVARADAGRRTSSGGTRSRRCRGPGRARPVPPGPRGPEGRRSRARPAGGAARGRRSGAAARTTLRHSVNPAPQAASFSGIGWYCGR